MLQSVANVTASPRPSGIDGWGGYKLPSDGWQTARLFDPASRTAPMDWGALFERGADYETSVETVRNTLADRRAEADGD